MANETTLVVAIKKDHETLEKAKVTYDKIKLLLVGETGLKITAYTSETHNLDIP